MQKSGISAVVLAVVLLAASLQRLHGTMAVQNPAKSRSLAAQLQKDGNFAEALPLYQALVEDSENGGETAAGDLRNGVSCLQQLNRVDEVDDLLESAVEAHPEDSTVLAETADRYNSVEHYGFLIGGQFHRGHHRGGGNQVSAQMRDRVRSLQLLVTAMSLVQKSDNASPSSKANVSLQLANLMGAPRHSQAWKLQDLTDLTTLPDYDKAAPMHHWRGGFGGSQRGAPVDLNGEPILYALPNSWDTATSDGERWRWALNQMAVANPGRQSEVDLLWAQFLQSQFGVRQQLHARRAARQQDGNEPVEGLTLHTLTDTETLARLATGNQKLTLPAEFNHLSVLQSVIDRQDGSQRQAIDLMIQIRMNRHQYPQAAELLHAAVKLTHNRNERRRLQERISQIEDNWMQFESVQTQAAGKPAILDIRYRNGDQVTFTARPINIEQVLTDTRKYLESQPPKLDHNKLQIQNVGHRLISDNQKKYLGKPVANWKLALQPPEGHFDGLESVHSPLKDAGAYWIEAKIKGGNTSRIVLWIADTGIAKKHIEEGTLYYVADAATGKPVSEADLEFFGFRQERINHTRDHRIITSRFADRTDKDGLCIVSQQKREHLQWVSIARTKEGRLAFEGFSNLWNPQKLSELHYSPVKVFTVTDRPVYRPEHKVQFRMWVRQPRFHEDKALYANRPFVLQISNPRGDVVEEHKVTTDQWGGIDGEWPIPADAVLGSYSLAICRDVNDKHKSVIGSGSFKVEEYRKPEFEVTIDAPDEPVKLGDTISATINARYYFGAPVTNAKVHYKVERFKKDSRWFPETRWDWLYSPGYWWFAPDTAWYPGWKHWGCFGPTPSWIGWNPDPPEVVSEGDAAISEDGTFQVEIDTESALQQHSDSDHSYRITAQVVDQSRRTISATGEVLVAREPFKVFVWTDKGHYQTGDTVNVTLQARTPDGKGVAGQGKATLYEVTWNDDVADEREVEAFEIATNDDGSASLKMVIPKAGQYRISCSVADAAGNTQEGGQLLYVRGAEEDGRGYRFNDLELIVEKRNYHPGETAVLQINADLPDSTVLLFVRPVDGVCPRPEVIRLTGKSTSYDLKVRPEDMPNFYVEALTIADGRMHSAMKEIFVPPTQKVAEVEVVASQQEYRPGETAAVTLKITDENGLPFVGNTIITAYDASLEYVAANAIPEIRDFFWNVRRHHYLRVNSTLERGSGPLYRQGEQAMQRLSDGSPTPMSVGFSGGRGVMMKSDNMEMRAAPAASMAMEDTASGLDAAPTVEPTVRSNFADTALWIASTDSTADGIVTAKFKVPDNLTTWKIKVWTLGEGTRVGSGTTDIVCSKKLIIRPQTPRFFTEKDQITLSAIVHNYLDSAKDVEVVLETEGGKLRHLTASSQTVRVEAGGEVRVDWPVQVIASGTATVRMKALTDEESDAAQLTVPAQIYGILKTESFAGVIRPSQDSAKLQLRVPAERIEQHSRLEIRYSPSLAGAMVDALPYLIEYPYGCTEQTLNRFLPAVLTQRTLLNAGLNLDDIRRKQTNLNAQKIGDSARRKQRWNQHNPNPVFDTDEMNRIVRDGVQALTEMQLSDGGWGWFSGYGEHSSAHLTALVVHGLTVAKANDVPVLPDVINRGVAWLKTHQVTELEKLREGDRRRKAGNKSGKRRKPYRMQAGNMDALVTWVLSEHDGNEVAMTDYLYRDRLKLSVYGMCLSGLVLDTQQSHDRRDMILRNIEQYLQQDNENQTAWLKLPGSNWWQWYGSENEAHSMYLRLLLKVRPKDEIASRVVKYLLNNRRAAGHWSSTRDTALVIESLAEYIRVTGEDRPDMTIEVTIDGQLHKRVKINADNFFSFDNVVLLEGDAVPTGTRNIEIRRTGSGPVYFNAYLTNFTQEDPITAAGLEVKVRRRFYRLERDDRDVSVRGDRGQAVHQQATRWKRIPLENLGQVNSGDLVEVELLIDSKNDYEYLLLEDRKPSGFEPDDQRSGYVNEGLRAYRELRDDRVSFFLSQLARGNHSISYRLRAETPGRMAALPARIEGMYAPELVGNSNDFKLQVTEMAEKQQ
jgi:uncharacterized protein YfaS (alpha-2-macroglobulin family)/tetratricopeptide (TPR) repeat protein